MDQPVQLFSESLGLVPYPSILSALQTTVGAALVEICLHVPAVRVKICASDGCADEMMPKSSSLFSKAKQWPLK